MKDTSQYLYGSDSIVALGAYLPVPTARVPCIQLRVTSEYLLRYLLAFALPIVLLHDLLQKEQQEKHQ